MSEIIVLSDYSPVPEESVEFCKQLQEAIERNNSHILRLYTDVDDEDDGETEEDWDAIGAGHGRGRKKTLEVFGSYNGKYSVGGFVGILSYQARTVYIHSRFDGQRDRSDGQKDRFLDYVLRGTNVPAAVASFSEANAVATDLTGLLLPRLFLKKLSEAFQLGPFRQYRTFEYNDSRVRGHIDFARHIQLNPLENGRIAYSVREYTLDNPVNHIILAAIGILRREYGQELAFLLRADPVLRRPVEDLEAALGREDLTPVALRRLLAHANESITHPMLYSYEELRRLAIRIIAARGVSPFDSDEKNDQNELVSGILLPMSRVWERFLENKLSQFDLKRQKEAEVDILLPGKDGSGSGRRSVKPDLFISGKGVFDAKYRKPWSEAFKRELKEPAKSLKWIGSGIREDVFQILSYMYIFQLHTAGVVFPYPLSGKADSPVPVPFCVTRGMNDVFWLLPFPIPTDADSQAEFDQLMDSWSAEFVETLQSRVLNTRSTEMI